VSLPLPPFRGQNKKYSEMCIMGFIDIWKPLNESYPEERSKPLKVREGGK
jgi:hypothetical protein